MKKVFAGLALALTTTLVCVASAQQPAPKPPPKTPPPVAVDAGPPPPSIPPGKEGVCSIYSSAGALLKSTNAPPQAGSPNAYEYRGCARALVHDVKPEVCRGKDPRKVQWVYVSIGTAAARRSPLLCKDE